MSASKIIDVLPIEHEHLSAKDFQSLVRDNPGIIKESKFVPAKLGSRSFGSFSVTYTRPIYKTFSNFNNKQKLL